MKFTRDAAIWTVFIIGGAATFITGHWDKFPFIPHEYQGLVEMIGVVVGMVGAKLSMSPVPLSAEGKANQQIKDLGTPQPPQTPPVLPPAAALLLVLLLPGVAQAQVSATLPTEGERRAADIASYAVLGVELALDTKASFDCPDRAHCLWMQLLRDGSTYAGAEILKRVTHERRPCEPACGVDSGTGSLPSMHMAFAVSTVNFLGKNKPRLVASLTMAVGTGEGRVLAGKHNWWDVAAGAALGAATSFLR